jgi:hypothetical protein
MLRTNRATHEMVDVSVTTKGKRMLAPLLINNKLLVYIRSAQVFWQLTPGSQMQ